MAKRGFLKPNLDDDFFKEDKVDVDAQKNTTFVYNPVQSWSLNAQQSRLPIAKNRDHILYLLEKNQVLVLIGGKIFIFLNFYTFKQNCITIFQILDVENRLRFLNFLPKPVGPIQIQ